MVSLFLLVCVCVCALTCTWTLISVHWCFKSAATPGRSETCGCVALCQHAVCVFLNMCLYVCLFIPTFVQTALCCTSDACLSFCSPILSHFLSLWHSRSLTVVTCTHTFVVKPGLKVICSHFLMHSRAGRHVLKLICSRTVLCPFVDTATFAWEGTCVRFHMTDRQIYCRWTW